MKLSPISKFILGLFAILFGLHATASAQQWSKLPFPGNTEVYCMLPVSGDSIYAGTSAGLYLSANNGNTWSLLALESRTVQSLAVKGTMMFAGLAGIGVQRSTDNGFTWTESSNGLPSGTVYSILVRDAYIFAATNVSGVYVSSDNGNSWSQTGTFSNPDVKPTVWVYSLAISGSTIFAGTFGDGLFKSTDNGVTWIKSDSGLTNPTVRTVYTRDNSVYAGTLGGGSFRSVNPGNLWVDISKGLGSKDVRAIIVGGGSNNNLLIVGTYGAGAYRSGDTGKTWVQFIDNLEDLHINSYAIVANNLLAGTNSGIFRASLAPSGVDESTVSSANGISVFPQPFGNGGFSVKLPETWKKGSVRLMLSNMLGERVVDMELSSNNSEYIPVQTNQIPQGVYILRALSGNESVTRTIIKE